jgi:putative transposase
LPTSRVLVADFTYVPLATGGFAYVAFVIDAFAGTIRGWEASMSKETPFVQRAIAQAAGQLRRLGHPVTLGAVHHSDYAEVDVKPENLRMACWGRAC